MGEQRDPPIEPLAYLSGVKIVDIGDIRVARGKSRRPQSSCRHSQLNYDTAERRIWCRECETNIEPFDAFEMLVKQFHSAAESIERRDQEVKDAEAHALVSLAAKEIDKAWRRKKMVPACPHCREPLFPEDFKDGIKASYGREYAEAMKRRRNARRPSPSGEPG